MNYIINPVWFYLISVADGMKLVSIFGIIIFAGLTFCVFVEDGKLHKPFLFLTIACLIASILIPSETVLIRIMVAKYATYDNAATAIQAIQNTADYIIESMVKLK